MRSPAPLPLSAAATVCVNETQVTHDQKVPSVVFGALTDDHRENVQRAWVVVAPLVGGMQARTSPSTSLSFRSLRAEYFQNAHPEILG